MKKLYKMFFGIIALLFAVYDFFKKNKPEKTTPHRFRQKTTDNRVMTRDVLRSQAKKLPEAWNKETGEKINHYANLKRAYKENNRAGVVEYIETLNKELKYERKNN